MRTGNLYSAVAFMAAAFAISCSPKAALKVVVENDSQLDRTAETIELDVDVLSAADISLNADNLTVLDKKGNQIPCQVYTEFNGAKTLVFQAAVPAGKTVDYYLAAGLRQTFDTLCYSRYVPEREDDYAYENNCMAGRIYGPKLQSPRTFGSDIWCKSTSRLVVDERYRRGHYHDNHGDGMDCYKVGNTLGGGALVPYVKGDDGEEHLVLGDNWAAQQHLTDGPVRTKAYLTYGPFMVEGKEVTAIREFTLDAGSHFAKWTTKFLADTTQLNVALGAIQHKVKSRTDSENFIAFTEEASDTRKPEEDGDISVGVVLDPSLAAQAGDMEGHAVLKTVVPVGQTVVFWTGSGWSQSDVTSAELWAAMTKDLAYASKHPLKVTVTAAK